MDELLERIKQFREERNWDQFHSPKNLVMALMVEVAELAEHFQWLTEEQSRKMSPEEVEKLKGEVGDVLIYLVNLADKLGIDPLQAAQEKIILNARKYPADRVRSSSKKYSEY